MEADEQERGEQRSPLTPSEELTSAVLELIQTSNVPMSRSRAFNAYNGRYKPPKEKQQDIKTHIGFALTILHEKRQIGREGKGIRGNPYRYTSKNHIDRTANTKRSEKQTSFELSK